MKRKWIIGFLIILGLQSCKKIDPFDCLKSTGRVVMEERQSIWMSYISLSSNVNLIIIPAGEPYLLVEAGENLMPSVKTTWQGDSLFINNENSCNWVRSYEHQINVYVHVKNLLKIDYHGSGNITSTKTLVSDSLVLDIREGSGSVKLDIETGVSYINLHKGTSSLDINGSSGVTYVFAGDYGLVDCEGLESCYLFINNRGTNDCYIRVTYELGATIEYLGNIYYYGNPSIVHANLKGSGKLIKME